MTKYRPDFKGKKKLVAKFSMGQRVKTTIEPIGRDGRSSLHELSGTITDIEVTSLNGELALLYTIEDIRCTCPDTEAFYRGVMEYKDLWEFEIKPA